MEYICDLHGYLIRLKEIHWSTSLNSEHLLCDDIMDSIWENEDRLAESAMGVYGQKIKIGELTPYLSETDKLIPLLSEMEEETIELKKELNKPNEYGLVNVLDDILTDIGKFKYRATQK